MAQMHPREIGDDDLCVVRDLRTALLDIEHIIEQGEASASMCICPRDEIIVRFQMVNG